MTRGLIDNVFGLLQDHPSVAAGTCTFAVAFALVAGNAFYAQSGSHPDPIWATRDAIVTHSLGYNTDQPGVRPVAVTTYKPKTVPVPLSRETAIKTSVEKVQKSTLVEDIQALLVASGDFAGEVDGLYGPVTEAAILNFEKRNGLPQTGKATYSLFKAISENMPGDFKKASPDKNENSLTAIINASLETDEATYDQNMVERIQKGLAKQGIADIVADGIYGSRTQSAILDFQRRYNLDATGKPDQKVLEKLITLGALSQG